MQSISFILKRKCARMVPKVRVGKMKIKTWNVRFFKCSSSKKARAVILELCVGTIYSIVKFEYQRSTILIEGAFEKTNIIQRLCLPSKTTFQLEDDIFICLADPGGAGHVEVFQFFSVRQSVGLSVGLSVCPRPLQYSIVLNSQLLKACVWDNGLGIGYF